MTRKIEPMDDAVFVDERPDTAQRGLEAAREESVKLGR